MFGTYTYANLTSPQGKNSNPTHYTDAVTLSSKTTTDPLVREWAMKWIEFITSEEAQKLIVMAADASAAYKAYYFQSNFLGSERDTFCQREKTYKMIQKLLQICTSSSFMT